MSGSGEKTYCDHPYLSPTQDLPTGDFIQEERSRCGLLCEGGGDCCDAMASCMCGTRTGQYDCVCERGHYGKGQQHECTGRTGRKCTHARTHTHNQIETQTHE